MEANKFKKAKEIEKDIQELEYFRTLLESYFSGKVIEARVTIKYDGQSMEFPHSNITAKSPNDGLCYNYKDRFFVLISQLIKEKQNEFNSL